MISDEVHLFDTPVPISWNTRQLGAAGEVRKHEVRGKWINYASVRNGRVNWSAIDLNFQYDGNCWRVDQSPWEIECPQLATGRIVAANRQCWDVHNSTTVIGDASVMEIEHIGARPVEGLLLPGREWQVFYPDAFDDGIGLALSQWNGRGTRSEHLFVFSRVPPGDSDIVALSAKIRTNGHIPDWAGDLRDISTGASVVLRSDDRLGYTMRPAVGWYYDAAGELHVESLSVTVERKVDHVLLTKLVPRRLIEEAVNARPNGELRVDQTSTFYPDANPEANTCDGSVTRIGANVTYSTLTNSTTGSSASDSSTTLTCADLQSSNTPKRYSSMTRAIVGFSVSIPGATAVSATLGVTGTVKTNSFPGMVPGVALVGCSPASNTGLVPNDFGAFVKSLKSDTVFNYTASPVWSGSAVNEFLLNAAGISGLNLSGVNFFGLMDAGDYSDSPPGTWSTIKQFTLAAASADSFGTDSDPYLVITTTGGSSGSPGKLLLLGVGS